MCCIPSRGAISLETQRAVDVLIFARPSPGLIGFNQELEFLCRRGKRGRDAAHSGVANEREKKKIVNQTRLEPKAKKEVPRFSMAAFCCFLSFAGLEDYARMSRACAEALSLGYFAWIAA